MAIPYDVTGLSAIEAEAALLKSANETYTEIEVDNLLADKANQSDLDTHEADVSNPHSVTASQVGAYTKTEADDLLALKSDETQTVQRLARKEFDGGVALFPASKINHELDLNIGTGDFSCAINIIEVPTEVPTVWDMYYITPNGSLSSPYDDIIIYSRFGNLFVNFRKEGGSPVDNVITLIEDFHTNYGGTPFSLILKRESGVLYQYVNGYPMDTSGTQLPANVGMDLYAGFESIGGHPDQPFSVAGTEFFNTSLSDSQVLELNEIGTGAFLAKYPELKWGWQYTSDYSIDNGEWSSNTGTLTFNESVGGEDECIKLVGSNTDAWTTIKLEDPRIEIGNYYDISVEVYVPSTNTVASGFWLTEDDGVGYMTGIIESSNSNAANHSVTADTWTTLTVRCKPAESGRLTYYISGGSRTYIIMPSTDSIYFKNLRFKKEGCTSYIPMQEGKTRILSDNNQANLPYVIQGDYEHLKETVIGEERLVSHYEITNFTGSSLYLNAITDGLVPDGIRLDDLEIEYISGTATGVYLDWEDGVVLTTLTTATNVSSTVDIPMDLKTDRIGGSGALILNGSFTGFNAIIRIFGKVISNG